MARGGYRQPSNPAPVSGPSALSRRTDGGPAQPLRDVTGLPYGQNQALNDIQAAAPLANTPGPSAAPPAAAPGAGAPTMPAPPVPFGAPTQNPDEPVTAGSPLGPGPGPSFPIQSPGQAGLQTAKDTLTSVLATSGSPEAQALLSQLQGAV